MILNDIFTFLSYILTLFAGSLIGAFINNLFYKKQNKEKAKLDEIESLYEARPNISVTPISTDKEEKTDINFFPQKGNKDISLKYVNAYFDYKFNRYSKGLLDLGDICHQQLDNFSGNKTSISASEKNFNGNRYKNKFRFLIEAQTDQNEKIQIYHFAGDGNYYFFETKKDLKKYYGKIQDNLYLDENSKDQSKMATEIKDFDSLIEKSKRKNRILEIVSNGNLLINNSVTGDTTLR